ncbi:DUF2586 domain-containing protein [uncultured Amphritea sp.]|uniref:DUF2586 domain-containing protein n=1 Tax=uncultured Amphritea sp. TaxID=981605 RepID=UPI0025F20DE8|nr:DUF2586 domain-containing protein [uncultured Amphritea sp.]
MSVGQVQVNHVNLVQGGFDEIERQVLFIGTAAITDNDGTIIPVSNESDLDVLLGAADSDLKTQVVAARDNAGQNWQASIAPIVEGTDWRLALDMAMQQNAKVEMVAVCTPVVDQAAVDAAYAKTMEILGTYQRFLIIGLAVSGIDATPVTGETWAEYIARINPVTSGAAANRVFVVPQLHGNNLGVLMGRLCNRAASIADTPMRVITGALVGLGDEPTDIDGVPLDMAHLKALDQARFSVPQWYPDYPGTYWADCNLLDIPAGDFQVIEHMRVLDYLARRVRVLAIARVADRKLNRTAASIEFNKTYFQRPLREASKSTKFKGVPFPAMILPPLPDDIAIVWTNSTDVQVYISAQPYNCPKKITVNLMLDLTN